MARPVGGVARGLDGAGPAHPLRAAQASLGLREHVDDVLRGHAAMLERAVAQLALRTDAAVLCRAFILQLLYPVGSRRYWSRSPTTCCSVGSPA